MQGANGDRGSITVIGGGIIGLASAWYLRRDRWRVTVVDKGRIGGACSHGNCGLICPSHVLPLAEPGALGEAIRATLRRNSPLRIRPRMDAALWRWMLKFARRCNERAMLEAAAAIQPLLQSSMREYEELVQDPGIECEWMRRGLLFVYQSEKALDDFAATNRLLSERFGEPARRLGAADAVQLEPALKSSVAGGWYYEEDAHLRPDLLISALKASLARDGVRFLEQCAVQGLQGRAATASTLLTATGEIDSDHYLYAAGAWTPMLGEQLGVRLPIQPGKGYSLTMPRPEICPEIPMIFPEHRVAVTPMATAYRLGSIMEFCGYDESIRPDRLALLRRGAAPYLKQSESEPVLEQWFGWRPMTYDSLPIIDRSPKWQNVWVATGHNMLGLTMAPATGRLVAELLAEASPHVDPAPYRVDRFG